MSYDTQIVREQGGSVLRIDSQGKVNYLSGGSLQVDSGADFSLGNTRFLFGSDTPPTVSASPGAIYFASDGSASNLYVNVSSGTTGSVWKGASIFS